MYDLGADAIGKPTKVAYCKDAYRQGTKTHKGYEIPPTEKPVKVSAISAIPSRVSKKLQLVCLTTKGHRMYCTTLARESPENPNEGEKLFTELRALFIAKSPVKLQENVAYGSKYDRIT